MSQVRCARGMPVGGFTAPVCHILTHLCDVASVWAGPPEAMVIQGITAMAVDVALAEFGDDAAKRAYVAKVTDALGPLFLVLVRQRGTEGEHLHISARL